MALSDLAERMTSSRRPTDTQATHPSQSETRPAEVSPVVSRTREVVEWMLSQATKGSKQRDSNLGVFIKIMPRLLSEAIEELAEKDVPESAMQFYMLQTAALAHYAATGNKELEGLPFPEGFAE